MKLLIFPHAGGSARGYTVLKKFFPENIELLPVEPAGRGTRIKEQCFEDLDLCVSDMINMYKDTIASDDYAVFGHSMGTALAVEFVRQATEKGMKGPVHAFLSARCAPDKSVGLFSDNTPDDNEVVGFFEENGLLPDTLLSNREMLDIFSKIIGADVRMTEKYIMTPDRFRFSCDITVMYAEDDLFTDREMMEGWRRFSDGKCNLLKFYGGHFYYLKQKEEICRHICDALKQERTKR